MKKYLLAAVLAATTSAAFARVPRVAVPDEIYQPKGAQTVAAQYSEDGGFEGEFLVRGTSVRQLADRVSAHAKARGFRLVGADVEADDADLLFERAGRELDVEIERKGNGTLKYSVDLDDRD